MLKSDIKLIKFLLLQCCEERYMIRQNIKGFNYSLMNEYNIRLTVLLENAEVLDCGSIGGYSKGQPQSNITHKRLNFLLNKYLPEIKHLPF